MMLIATEAMELNKLHNSLIKVHIEIIDIWMTSLF